ncbi:MAG: hypothetical protein Fur0019_00610 [Tibeticola sp.]
MKSAGPTDLAPCRLDACETQDYAALVRHLGGIQRRFAAQTAELTAAARALEAETLRLRAERIVCATARYWTVPPGARAQSGRRASAPGRTRTAPASAAVHEVLCRTGCQGHAHPWRTDDGRCALDGEECDRRTQPSGR